MATTMATMAMLKPKFIITNTITPPTKLTQTPKSIPLILTSITNKSTKFSPITSAALSAVFFSTLSSSNAALAAQALADVAEGSDNRGLALLLPIVPAVLWVLYNILQPALNQLNRMRSEKAVVVGLGLGAGLVASGLASTPSVSAAEAASGDNRGLLLLIVVAPAIAWVLFNILQPALNQLNKMRSG